MTLAVLDVRPLGHVNLTPIAAITPSDRSRIGHSFVRATTPVLKGRWYRDRAGRLFHQWEVER